MENLSPISATLDLTNKKYVDDHTIPFSGYTTRWGPAWPSSKASVPFDTQAKWIYAYRVVSKVNISTIAVEVMTAAAGGKIRLGVYSDAYPWPGTLLLSSSDITTDAVGIKTATLAITKGAFWLAVHNLHTAAISMRALTDSNPYSPGSITTDMKSGFGYSVGSTTTPPTWPAGTGTDASAIMFLLKAT